MAECLDKILQTINESQNLHERIFSHRIVKVKVYGVQIIIPRDKVGKRVYVCACVLIILKPWANQLETLLRKHCFLPMFRHVSKSGKTLGNISEKHRETSNVSEFARKHFCFSGSKFCFRNNVSTGGRQTGKHCFLPMYVSPCFQEWANTRKH
jgi:hypothetical protein